MSREIKFRAWDSEDKKMYFFDLIDLRVDQEKSGMKDLFLADETTFVMQFTGLLDKNGVEIYEGDRLKSASGYLWEVAFGHGSFYLFSVEKDLLPDHSMDDDYILSCELVGNKYTSPSLPK